MNITRIATSTIFRKLPFDLIPLVLKNQTALGVMNVYTEDRYGDKFWLGGVAFNKDYRLVCQPNDVHFGLALGWPFFCKTVILERVPFTEGEDYAKFGLNWRLTEPLTVV